MRGPHLQPLQPHTDPALPAAMLRVVRGTTAADDQYLFRFGPHAWVLTQHPPSAHPAPVHGVGRAADDHCRTMRLPQQIVACCPGSASLLLLPALLLHVRAQLRALPLLS